MNIQVSPDYDEMSRQTAAFIVDCLRQKPKSLLCLASGHSPTGTFQYLVEYAAAGKADFSQCLFVGLDEWVGLDREKEGSCSHYMHTHLFDPLGIKAEQIVLFEGRSADPEADCKRVDRFISEHGPIDLMLLGIGMNGHIGFNEPGVSFAQYSHCIQLDPITKEVGQKYFDEETKLDKGLTLGLQHVSEARVAVLIANGAQKAAIVARALQGEITSQVPASILQTHPNAFVFLDEAAATELQKATKRIP